MRGLATVLLLTGFAVTGVLVAVGSLVLSSAVSPVAGAGGLFADVLNEVALWAAVLAAVPGAALLLLPRHRRAGSIVATVYGTLVVALTATHVLDHTPLLVAHLAGLALVLCAFPLEDPIDSAA